MLNLLSALPAGEVPGSGDQLVSTIFMFGMIFVIFYFLIIRPQQKKFKEHQALISGIAKGDSIVTSGGILGNVVKTADDKGVMTIKIAENVEIKVFANTISTVLEEKVKIANDNSKKTDTKKKNDNKKKK